MSNIGNKKALAGTTFTLIVATITVFFMLVVFFFLSDIIFNAKFGKGKAISRLVDDAQTELSLRNFLNSGIEIEIDGQQEKIGMSDLIRLYYIDNLYENKLKGEAERILKSFLNCYLFEINDLKIGNEKFFKNPTILELPLSTGIKVSISLAIDDKCLEKENE